MNQMDISHNLTFALLANLQPFRNYIQNMNSLLFQSSDYQAILIDIQMTQEGQQALILSFQASFGLFVISSFSQMCLLKNRCFDRMDLRKYLLCEIILKHLYCKIDNFPAVWSNNLFKLFSNLTFLLCDCLTLHWYFTWIHSWQIQKQVVQSAKIMQYCCELQQQNIMNRLTTKRKDFYTQIRRQQITQKINQIRKTAIYDFITLQELAKLFNINQSSEHQSITIIDLLIEKRHLLLEVPLGDIEQENIERLPLEAHIRFWKYYSQQLFDEKVRYDPQLGKVLLSIVSKYSYAQVHYSTVYQLHLLNMLQLIAPNLTLKQKEKLIDWVAGAQGLRVISACIESNEFEFFKYKFYPNLYKVIQIGLKSELKNESDQAAEILYKILLKADWDDTFQLYQFAQGLMIYLCTKIERYYKDTVIKFYSLSVVLLLDTYDEAVLDYARGTAAYAAALLIISPIQQNYGDGLQILQALTQIDSKKIVNFLLSSRQIRSTGLWSKLCQQTTFPRHLNAKIRQNYLSIFHNLLALGEQPQLEEISDLFSENYENIFQMFGEVLANQVENEINIRLVLNSLMSFLFYDRVQNQPHMLLKAFETYGLCKQLIYLLESKQGQISQTCNNILAILGKNGSNI